MRLKISISLLACMCFVGIRGFLLDDRTTPAASSNLGLSDTNYNLIMAVIAKERDARIKLEKRVEFLEQELQVTEKGVTDLYHLNQAYNQTISDQNNKINGLVAENGVLKRNIDDLKSEVDELKHNNTQIQNELFSVRQQVVGLQQLKGVSDLKAILDLQDKTNRLDGELKVTNTKMNSMLVDIEARKQDFMALYSQASAAEKNLERAEASLNKTLTLTIQHQNQTITDIKDELFGLGKQQNATTGRVTSTIEHQNKTMTDIIDELKRLSQQQNMTEKRQDYELRNMSGRAILTTCAYQKTYSGSDRILFPYVHTKSGISNDVIADFGKTGTFKVEKPGIYLISLFFMTNTHGHVEFYVYKNGSPLSYGYTDVTNYYQTSTVVLIEHFRTNDTLYVTTYGNPEVFGDKYSCITLLQLTEDM